jgi:hypothetical protein
MYVDADGRLVFLAVAQLERLGRSTGYFCGADAQKRESNQWRLIANRL